MGTLVCEASDPIMDCLEYSDANELFSELVNDISGACAIGQDVEVS